jgi:hypothetical protein
MSTTGVTFFSTPLPESVSEERIFLVRDSSDISRVFPVWSTLLGSGESLDSVGFDRQN